MQPTEQNKSPF